MKRTLSFVLAALLLAQTMLPAFAVEADTAAELGDELSTAEAEETEGTEEAEAPALEEEVPQEEPQPEITEELVQEPEEGTEDPDQTQEGEVPDQVTEEPQPDAEKQEKAAEEADVASEPEQEQPSEDFAEPEAEEAAEPEEEQQSLYHGMEADYADPQFVKLLESGFFDEDMNAGISVASSTTYSHNSCFDGYAISKGVDVSKWNGSINWSKVKNAGISFALIRCGYRSTSDSGALNKDEYFKSHIEGALAAGIEVGVYVYSQAITEAEAREEANLALEMCKNYSITLPIIIDYEYYTSGRLLNANLSKTQRTNICKAFCEVVEAAGYSAMIYANKGMLTDDMYGQQLADAGYEVWLAQWRSSTTYEGTYTYWQYTDAGNVNGITGYVDMNFRYQLPGTSISETYNLVNGVRLVWSKISVADGYRIYRKASGETAWTCIAKLTGNDTLTYVDQTAAAGTKYQYSVQSYDGSVRAVLDRTGVTVTYQPQLSLVSAANSLTGIQLNWQNIGEYDSYRILRRTGSSGSWTVITTVSDTKQTSYLDKSVVSVEGRTDYYYTIVGVRAGKQGSYDAYGYQATWISAPVLTGASAESNGMKIAWKAVTGAAGYRVYRKSGGSWTLIGTVKNGTTVQYIDTQATVNNTTYTYTVRAYDAAGALGAYSTVGISGLWLSMPILTSAVAQDNGIWIEWKAVTGAVKYRVFRKTSNGSWVALANQSATSFTDTTATSGMTYTYTVRCISGDGKTYTSGYDTVGKSAIYILAPVISTIANMADGVQITWSKFGGAAKYRVFRKVSGGSWAAIGDTTDTSYTDAKAVSGTTYAYTIRCMNSAGTSYTSSYDPAGKSITYIAAPVISSVSNAANGVQITWSKPTGAVKYRVFRKAIGGNWSAIGETTATSYTDAKAASGTTYAYTIRCINSAGTGYTSSYDAVGKSVTYIAAPLISSIESTVDGVQIAWEKPVGAVQYRVFRKVSGGSWTAIGDTTDSSYIDAAAVSGRTYTYTIRCINSAATAYTSSYDVVGKSVAHIVVPRISTIANTADGVQITWSKFGGAAKYRVFRKVSGGSWAAIGDTTDTSYTDTKAVSGTTYAYTIRCMNSAGTSYTSSYDPAGKSIIYIAAPIISSVSNAANGVQITWSKPTGAVKYRVFRKAIGGNWSAIGETTATSYTDAKAASGTTYAYTIRCINSAGTGYTSSYDAVGKSVTYIAAPLISSIESTVDGVQIAWEKPVGAVQYRVFRKVSGGSWTAIGDTTDSSYIDAAAVSGRTYTYTIRCINSAATAYTSSYDVAGKSIQA